MANTDSARRSPVAAEHIPRPPKTSCTHLMSEQQEPLTTPQNSIKSSLQFARNLCSEKKNECAWPFLRLPPRRCSLLCHFHRLLFSQTRCVRDFRVFFCRRFFLFVSRVTMSSLNTSRFTSHSIKRSRGFYVSGKRIGGEAQKRRKVCSERNADKSESECFCCTAE